MLLHRIRTEVTALRVGLGRSDSELLSDVDSLPAMKYRLIVAIEAAIDVADHIIASEGLRPSTSFADSFRSLGEAGWVESGLASRLEGAARFRNLLVHQYADVDDSRVIGIARQGLDDLDEYVQTIASRVT